MTNVAPWLPHIPTNWRRGRLKDLVGMASNGVWGEEPLGDDTDIKCVRAADFDRASLRVSPDKLPARHLSFQDRTKHLLTKGDLVLEKSGGGEKQLVGAAVLFDLDEPAVCSNFCARLTPAPGVDSRYLSYVLASVYSQKLNELAIKQTTGIQNLDSGAYFATPWAWPEEDEQRRIANFLDAETARIDRLAELRRHQQKTLEERAYAAISEILIPGILTAPRNEWPWPWLPHMEPSMPLVRLGYVCRLQNGLTVDSKRDSGRDAVVRPYLRVANVQAGYVDLGEVSEIKVPREMAERSTLRSGDVLMTEGGDLDKLGRGTVWRGELPNCLHQNHVFAIRPEPDRLDADYLALMTQSLHGRCYFESTGSRTTNLASTNSSKILSFPIPLPSMEKQRKLTTQAQTALESASLLKQRLARQLELLAEHRQALITAAVTGQFDVATASGQGVA